MENKLMAARGKGVGSRAKLGEGEWEIQALSCEMNKG